ncbi:MAG: FprA family A-type flavoprotein [Prevotellaceae bacterium]|jgi:flavorubredoxin|nr:FprA family A-type flavoprotein [Prevotellaceae bacterium]
MFGKIKISDKIFWTGVNDRRKALFENIWPLPEGVCYNSYIIVDEKTALIDTVDFSAGRSFLDTVEKHLEGKTLDYLIINHMELDHTGEVSGLLKKYPEIKIVGNINTRRIFESYFGATSNFLDVGKGETIDLGYHRLGFVMTPWVHWPETMMTYDRTEKVLFSGDAFGTFGALNGGIFDDEIDFNFYEGEALRYYSNIVGKYSGMVQKAFAKLAGVEIKCICPTHGPVWRDNPKTIIDLYDRWSRYEADEGVVIVFASMYGNTENIADYIARKIAEAGVKNIRIHDVSKTHISYLIRDIWKYRGIILGSCSYNAEMFPAMEHLCREITHAGLKNRKSGIFGTFSWNGGGVKNLRKFAEDIKWEQVAEAVEFKGIPADGDYSKCDALAAAMAREINSKIP